MFEPAGETTPCSKAHPGTFVARIVAVGGHWLFVRFRRKWLGISIPTTGNPSELRHTLRKHPVPASVSWDEPSHRHFESGIPSHLAPGLAKTATTGVPCLCILILRGSRGFLLFRPLLNISANYETIRRAGNEKSTSEQHDKQQETAVGGPGKMQANI